MALHGVVASGNYFRTAVSLDGPLTIRGGNWVLAEITTNGHALTLEGGNRRGLKIDGVKQDAYVWQRREPWPTAISIRDQLSSGGQDAMDAFARAVDVIQGAAPGQTWTQFQTAYAAAAPDNLTYSANLLARVQRVYNGTWTQVRDWIRSHPRARLLGEETELVEEYS